MTHYDASHDTPRGPGLPDPARQPAFYQGTAPKRAIAWVLDGIVIFVLTGFFQAWHMGLLTQAN